MREKLRLDYYTTTCRGSSAPGRQRGVLGGVVLQVACRGGVLLAQAHEVSMVTIQGDEGNVMSVECTCVYGMFRDGHNGALACRARLPQRADREDQSQGASSIYVLCCEYSTSVSPPHTQYNLIQ